MFRLAQAAWKPSEGTLIHFRLNGAWAISLNGWHGDANLEPVMAYKFFDKFSAIVRKEQIQLRTDLPKVTVVDRKANQVVLSNGQAISTRFFDYYAQRYGSSCEMRSAGANWPVIWVDKDDKIKGFVCPLRREP